MFLVVLHAILVVGTTAFSAGTAAIWGPSSTHHVFLRPPSYNLTTPLTRAIVIVSAGPGNPRLLGSYRLFINGADVTIGPGRGDVPTGSITQSGNALFDVVSVPPEVLAISPRQLAVALQCAGAGWAMLQLRGFDSQNNTVLEASTSDPSWRAFNADAIFVPGIPDTCGRVNEDIDAGAFAPVAQWRSVGFDPMSANWLRPETVTPSVQPVAKTTLPLRTEVGLKPVVLTQLSPLHWFFDFGVERMAGVALTATAPQGTLLQVTLSEQLSTPTTVMYPESSSNRYRSTFRAGSGVSIFEMHEYVGLWRYGELLVLNATAVNINFTLTRWAVAYPFSDTDSDFASDNTMLNSIWKLMRDTLKHTSLDTFTDSNTRERLPYEADGYITARSRWALQQEYAWPKHSTQHVLMNPTWPTEWKQFTVLLAHEHYMQTGDSGLADANFELLVNNTMLPFIDSVSQLVNWTGKEVKPDYNSVCHGTDGYFPPGVSDGGRSCDITDWQPSYRQGFVFTAVNTIINAFAVKSLELLSELANATGRVDRAISLRNQALKTRAAMLEGMYNPNTQMWCDGLCTLTTNTTYHTQHFAAWLGLTPDSGIPTVLAFLQSKGMVGSVYASHSVIHGLYERAAALDNGAAAFQLLTQCSANSWCQMVQQNATTSWEMWGALQGTHSHPWSTTPASAIANGLMGVRPTTPGWLTWEIRPAPGSLQWANITVPTPHGPLKASYEASTRSLRVSGPPGGRVCLRRDGGTRLRVDGKWISATREGSYLCVARLGRIE